MSVSYSRGVFVALVLTSQRAAFPFARSEVTGLAMTAEKKAREAIREHLVRPSERSSLFWWLLENHDWMLEEGAGRRFMWTALCPKFAELGLTDRTGKPPGPKVAKLTWERARKEKARVEARRAAIEAERVAKAAANPRNRMPSHFARRNYLPPLAVSPQTPSAGAVLWMGKYSFGNDGMIIVIDNPSSAVYAQQERNLRSTRPINDGIERFIKSKE
jgi:hypothetical protein